MNKRVKELQRYLSLKGYNALLITNKEDIEYLTNFTGSTGYVLLTNKEGYFYTDGRYKTQALKEVNSYFCNIIVNNYSKLYSQYLPKFKNITVQKCCTISTVKTLENEGCQISVDEDDLLLKLRMIKEDIEIQLIEEEYKIAGKAFKQALICFEAGLSENYWAGVLEYNMKLLGAKSSSFETIIASGTRSSMPHGIATDKIINITEPVIVDFGCKKKYTSDYTRMIYSGNNQKIRTIIDIVKDSLLKSIDSIKVGMQCAKLDSIAREYIASYGYGEYFNHSLGHGIGLNVHESPNISSSSNNIIENGMVFTIEPGIYLDGEFGIRLEETVLIQNDKPKIISSELSEYVYGFTIK